jgi:hypothetical protein
MQKAEGRMLKAAVAKWLEYPTSSIPHPNPHTASRRKSRRKVTWISSADQKRGFEGGLWV